MELARHPFARPSAITALVSLSMLGGCMGFSDSELFLATSLGDPTTADAFDDYDVGTGWQEGDVVGPWRVQFTGYGKIAVIDVGGDPALSLTPHRATAPDLTHASLVVSNQRFGDLEIAVTTQTRGQLREGSEPNPWEVGWLVWDYRDDDHFYYLIAKPNGWELGKRDPAYPGGQRFLATGSNVRFPVRDEIELRVRRIDDTIDVWVDDIHLVEFIDDERPYLGGRIGLYSEDASVLWDDVEIWDL
jgi:hypothetical protein